MSGGRAITNKISTGTFNGPDRYQKGHISPNAGDAHNGGVAKDEAHFDPLK